MDEREQLERAMEVMEAQRGPLGDAVVEMALAAFRERLAVLSIAEQSGAPGPSSRAEGQRRQVTALFAEICGLPLLDGTLSPPGLPALTGQLWPRLDAIITRYGGLVDRHCGDMVQAIFGAEVDGSAPALEDDPERAVRAALEMLAETRRFCASHLLSRVQLRVGLNSGTAVLGAAGADQEYLALGDAIQLAAQIQQAAEPGEALISQPTYRAVRGIFEVQTPEPLRLDGKPEPVPVYRVRGVRPRAFRLSAGVAVPGGRPAASVALTGRESELECLQTAMNTALSTHSVRLVTLAGEAGIGKSRLVHEFTARLDRSGQPYILFRGRGDWQHNRLPYALLRELLAFRFKILDADPPAMVREKLLRGVEEWLGPDGLDTAHWIGHLAGCEFQHSPFLNGRLDDPRRARQLAFQSLNRFLAVIARRTPLLILVDDLQWADEGSLDWVDSLARSEAGGPALLVGLTRPTLFERRPGWGERWTGHTRLDLAPLSDNQTALLAGQLLHSALEAAPAGGPLPGTPTVPLRRIVEQASGNPMFVEELVQAYLEDAAYLQPAVEPPGAAWQFPTGRLAGDRLPGSLVEALQARLDGLPPGEREVILHAAVVGPVFWEAALCVLLEPDSGSDAGEADLLCALDLPAALLSLQQRGLIDRRDAAAFEHTEEYAFRSQMLYQVAYESQLARRRRQDHARVAAWLAAQSGERVEAYAAAIAGHYERAEDPLQAAEWYGLAALQARRLSAPELAVRFFTRALDLLPGEPVYFAQRVQLYKGLWDVQWWQARYAEALATGQALLVDAETQQDTAAQAAAWNRVAAVQNRQGEYHSALRSVQRAERLARAGSAAREVVLALFNRGLTLYRLGDSAAALEAGEQALAFNQSLLGQGMEADREDDVNEEHAAREELAALEEHPERENTVRKVDSATREAARETARILSLLAMINQRAGRYTQAANDYRQVLDLQRRRGDRPAVVAALNNLGQNAQLQGDYAAAADYYQESLNLTQELGYFDLELVCLNHLSGALADLGEHGQAETGLREVLRRTEGGSRFLLSEVYRYLAVACLGQGRREEALAAGLRSLELARQNRSNEHIGRAWRILGRVAGAQVDGNPTTPLIVDGKPFNAHACYGASLQIFVEMGAAGEQARTVREWASYELEHGDRREGIRLWQEARDLFARLGLTVEVERMDHLAETRNEPD